MQIAALKMKQPKCLQMLPNVWEENRVPILVFILFLWQIQHVINQVCMGERHLMPLLFPPAAASGQMPFTASSILLHPGAPLQIFLVDNR